MKGNHDHNEKPLDIGLDQAPSIPGCIQSDGNCLFKAVAQEITGSQEDHAALRVLVTSYMAHNPTQLSCYLKSSETMENYLQRTKMDRQKVWATEVEIMPLPICVAQRYLYIVLQALATNGWNVFQTYAMMTTVCTRVSLSMQCL